MASQEDSLASRQRKLKAAYGEGSVATTERFAPRRIRPDSPANRLAGYDRPTAEKLITKIGWRVGEHIDGLVTASDVENGRPAPDMIHRAMVLTNTSAAAFTAKIGDSQIDIEEGKNAGCGMTIGITTGAQTAAQMHEAQPTKVIDHLDELLDVLNHGA